jgi:DNA repair exonuclease SbcCD nuclease subunit
MQKILLVSDLHIFTHKNSQERLKNCLDVLDWVFQVAHDKQIMDICFLGDLFHSRQKIDVATYQWTFEIFCKWMQKDTSPNVYLLVGNHDMAHKFKPDICSIKPLSSIDGVVVVDTPTTIEIGNHSVDFLPFTENPIEGLKTWSGHREILLGHIALDGAILNSIYQTHAEVLVEHDGDMTVVDTKAFKNWQRVFLGHYHFGQKIENIEYLGSPLQLTFGEAFQEKHLIIYDLITEKAEYVLNDFSPKHIILSKGDIDKYDLTNNFVRIMVDDISSSELVEFRNNLLSQNIGSLDIRQKPKKEEDSQAIDDALAVVLHNNLIIDKYIEYMDDLELLSGLNKDKLLEIGKKIIESTTDKSYEKSKI